VNQDVFGHEVHYLEARSTVGKLGGILPLVRVRSRLFGDYLVSMPFLNYGGPLGAPAAREMLCREAIAIARSLNVDLLELRARDHVPPGLVPNSRKLCVVVPLPPTPEELWENQFRSKLRNKIRRPMNQGMKVRFGPQELDAFYDIYSRNMRDLGTPVLPRRWFESIRSRLADITMFATVYQGDVPVASGCGFLWKSEFELSWSSSLREYNSRHPNMLLSWAMMKESITRGAQAFNFGRSTPGSSTHQYKQQWTGADLALPWGSWGRQSAPPNADSSGYRLARAGWSRMPLALSRKIGPLLSPYIP